jgi:hypothetical protein
MEPPMVNEPENENEEINEPDTFYDLAQVLKVISWARTLSNVFLVLGIVPMLLTLYSMTSIDPNNLTPKFATFTIISEVIRSGIYFAYWIVIRLFAEGLTVLLDIEHNTRSQEKSKE